MFCHLNLANLNFIHNNICFIHSCNMKLNGTNLLEKIITDIQNSNLISKLDYIIIINIGEKYNETCISCISFISLYKSLSVENKSILLNNKLPID